MKRRSIMQASALAAPFLLLGACTQTSPGTYSLNVASVVKWGTAFKNVAGTLSALPGIPGATATLLLSLGEKVTTAVAAFQAEAGSAATITFSTSNIPATVQSILADGNMLLTAAQSVLGTVAAQYVAQVQLWINALSAILSIFSAALGTVAAPRAGTAPMPEAAALLACGVAP